MLPEQVFGSQKVLIFPNDDSGNAIEQGCSSAHDAGAESADERQLGPVTTPACIANAHSLGVSCRVAVLHAQIMPTRNHVAIAVHQYRTDRKPTLAQTGLSLLDCMLNQCLVVERHRWVPRRHYSARSSLVLRCNTTGSLDNDFSASSARSRRTLR